MPALEPAWAEAGAEAGGDGAATSAGADAVGGGGGAAAEEGSEHERASVRGWEGICQHNRRRSTCKTCRADKDESMPPDLEEL